MRKITVLTSLIGLLMGIEALGAAPDKYYDGLEGLCGADLKKAVKSAATKNYISIPYGTKSSTNCTWKVFVESDTRYINGERCWWDMYSANNVPAPRYDSRGSMNIEHAVPNSWWGKDSSIPAYNDVMHLNPSDAEANNHKGNYPLGVVQTLNWSNEGNFTRVGKPAPGTCGGASNVFEPADEYKGDFARAYFYMFTAYDDIDWQESTNWMYDVSSPLTLKSWAYELLLDWDRKDPISQKEIDRNEAIYRQQGNRNPFIDCPHLAEYIWGNKRLTPYSYDGKYEDAPEVESGYWYPVQSSNDLNGNDKYIVVSTSSHIAMSMYEPNYATPYYLMECSTQPVYDNTVTPARISHIPDDIAVINLIPEGDNWVMSVADVNGDFKGYITSVEAKKMNLTKSADENGTLVKITPSNPQTSVQFVSGAGYLKYNGTDTGKRFTTYASGLESIMLYRYNEGEDLPGTDNPGNDDPGNKDEEDKPDVPVDEEYTVTENFTISNSGLPMGSSSKPASPKNYTSKETGIEYTIMGCYVNNYEAPFYLLVNGKNNEGAFISFTLDANCNRIELSTTAGCSTNPNSTVNFYADENLIGNYAVNVQDSSVSIEVPEEYREASTVYKIESATTAYNQQFAGFTYFCYGKIGGEEVIPVSRINLSPSDVEIEVNETLQLNAEVIPANATDKTLSWESSDTRVAVVSSTGLLTALAEGEAIITVRNGNIGATCRVIVKSDASVDGICVDNLGEMEIFDLNGRKLNLPYESLEKGIYIVRANNQTFKIRIK